jgi:hypothetical protein
VLSGGSEAALPKGRPVSASVAELPGTRKTPTSSLPAAAQVSDIVALLLRHNPKLTDIRRVLT